MLAQTAPSRVWFSHVCIIVWCPQQRSCHPSHGVSRAAALSSLHLTAPLLLIVTCRLRLCVDAQAPGRADRDVAYWDAALACQDDGWSAACVLPRASHRGSAREGRARRSCRHRERAHRVGAGVWLHAAGVCLRVWMSG
jgi:hypothetical protein